MPGSQFCKSELNGQLLLDVTQMQIEVHYKTLESSGIVNIY